MAEDSNDDFSTRWDARVKAIETILGPCEDIVGHAGIPFCMGADMGGDADIIYFRNHLPGVVSVTSELIDGDEEQVQNQLGNYELMICHRDDEEWGADLISRLAYYTLEAKIEPFETMDIRPVAPEGSTISAILFCDYARFEVQGRKAGLLLCLGITDEELAECRKGGSRDVLAALKQAGIYPFTDLMRQSVPLRKKRWFGW